MAFRSTPLGRDREGKKLWPVMISFIGAACRGNRNDNCEIFQTIFTFDAET